MESRHAAWLGLVGLLMAACSHDDGVVIDTSSQALSANVDRHFTVATTSIANAELAAAQRATGALFVPRRSPSGDDAILAGPDGTPLRSTCGVTFIDRTHAITAGHCVNALDIPDPATRPVSVELYEVGPELGWRSAAELAGAFPDYRHGALAGQLSYGVTQMSCTVTARCGADTKNERCPAQAQEDKADIALLTCGELPADREPVPVATEDDERGPVRMFWFHELYNAPLGQPDIDRRLYGAATSADLFEHYTLDDGTGVSNFHYFGNGRNDLLPLISSPWANTGNQRRGLGARPAGSSVVWTDLFGCRGAAGSGVMQLNGTQNRYVLLGPAATGSRDWADCLCTNTESHRAGRPSLSYTALTYTKLIAALLDAPAPNQAAAEADPDAGAPEGEAPAPSTTDEDAGGAPNDEPAAPSDEPAAPASDDDAGAP